MFINSIIWGIITLYMGIFRFICRVTIRNIENITALALFFVVSQIMVNLWFDGSYQLGVGDSYRAVDRYRFLRTADSGWRGEQNTGNYEFLLEYHIPASLVYFPLHFLGVSPVTLSKIWVSIAIFLPAFFMYLFVKKYWSGEVPWHVCVLGGLFYVFNPLTVTHTYGTSLTRFPAYLGLPIMAYYLIELFQKDSWLEKYKISILLSLSTSFVASSAGNFAELAPVFIVILVLLFSRFIKERKFLAYIVLFLWVFVLSLLLNFWWLYSSGYNIVLSLSGFVASVDKFGGAGPRILEAFRLFGFWALRAISNDVPYYSFGQRYYTKVTMLITYVVPILVFSALILKQYRKNFSDRVLLVSSLALLGVLLVKGASDPFGFWYVFLYDRYPVFRMFRESYAKFSLVTLFSFTTLLVVSVAILGELAKKRFKYGRYLVLIAFLAVTFYISYPMFVPGWIKTSTNGPMKQFKVKVPDYWYELEKYSVSNLSDYRIFTTPRTEYYRKSFLWESGFVGNPLELYVRGNWMYNRKGNPRTSGDEIISRLYELVELYNAEDLEDYFISQFNLSRLLNVGYVLQMNDLDFLSFGQSYNPWSISKMESFFTNHNNYYTFEKSFGRFTEEYLSRIPHVTGGDGIYRFETYPGTQEYMDAFLDKDALQVYSLNEKFLIGKFYVPNRLVLSDNTDDFIDKLTDSAYFDEKPLFIDRQDSVTLPYVAHFPVNVTYSKINDARYKVVISGNYEGPLPVVFSETFDDGWYLAEDCTWLRCTGRIEAPHYTGNYYANVWLLTKDREPLELYVVHAADFRLHQGLVVSGVSLVGAVVLYLFLRKKSRVVHS
jgi:hypothetical protein